MKILGYQSGHDVSYCMLNNGIPVIHEELERFTREKEPYGDGLAMAIERLPDGFLDETDYVVHGNPNDSRAFNSREYVESRGKKIYTIGHHQSHAANAFYSSKYDEALIVTIDGSGTEKLDFNDIESERGDFSTGFTIWKGKGTKIEPIHRRPSTFEMGLGGPWRKYTAGIFGLSAGHPHGLAAGTVMALASVGDPDRYLEDFYNAFATGRQDLLQANINKYKPIVDNDEQSKFDVAAAIQKATETVVYERLKPIIDEHQPKNICFSGGVILNSVMMGKMFEWFGIDNLYVCPVPYDAGLAIGCTQYLYHHVLDHPRVDWDDCASPYLGTTYSQHDVEKAIQETKHDITYEYVNDDTVLDLLDRQNIISVFHGGSESGRRALGNRSIIVDPRSDQMKDIINEKVKHRQWFRPFAPSILREEVTNWFVRDVDSPYMSFVVKFKEEVKDKVPAVVHLDGTGRLQTVTEKSNPWYYNFIKKWQTKTGVPIILNTSFNDREPIVETPEHAINCFCGTKIDYLYFSDYGILIQKK